MSAPRVLITRSPHQASTLADQLRAHGVDPILIPTIELAEPTTFAPLDAALTHLDRFHWLIFTSGNAVEAFAKRAVRSGDDQVRQGFSLESHSAQKEKSGNVRLQPDVSTPRIPLPPNLKIAAIGAATARALEADYIPVDLLPPQAIAESLTEALLLHSQQPDGSPTRFLLLRAEVAREHLPNTLRAAGADVTIAPVYRTIVPPDSIAAISHIFSSSNLWPAAITFTSSSTATNLLALLEAAGLTLPPEILRISIGPITSQTLRHLNLPPHAEAAEPNLPSLVAAVVKTLNLPESSQTAHSERDKTSGNLA
ncbi:MAG: uroporphyrinogen-III synthase [Acidobacteriaceae bacterium]